MKVCFFTLGTRGDVQPYVALGRDLIREGSTGQVS
jgi:UDP:flavonoid glycosyltransferase YjiC (YdhE family)